MWELGTNLSPPLQEQCVLSKDAQSLKALHITFKTSALHHRLCFEGWDSSYGRRCMLAIKHGLNTQGLGYIQSCDMGKVINNSEASKEEQNKTRI